jgi:peptide chain release factor subunit 1
VDERFTRILRGAVHALSEVVSFGDQVHGRHDQGGFSQARYQRSIREDAESHLRRTARLLADLRRVAPYERLLIACTQPLWSRMVEKLHADVRRTLHEQRLALDVADVSIAEVEAAVAPVLEAEHRRRLGELLADLHERLGRRERVASGLDAVLAALVERRVEALVYEAALSAPGVLCPRCGWLGREARNGCPVDGARLEARERILEDALAAAVGQSAELLPVDDGVQLEPFQGIAATLRF